MAEEQKTTWVVQIDADVSGVDKKVKDLSPAITGVQKKLQGIHTKINSITGKLETLTQKAAGVGQGMAAGFEAADKSFKELRKDILEGYGDVKEMTKNFNTMSRLARNVGKALVKGIDEAQTAVYSLMNTMSSPRIMQRTARNMKEAMKNSIGDNVSNIIDIRRQIAEDLAPQKDPTYKADSPEDSKTRHLAIDEKNKLVWVENEYNKELKEEEERNALIEAARKERMQEEMDFAANLEQRWQATQKAREDFSSVDSNASSSDGTKNVQDQLSFGQKLNQTWKNVNEETQKYANNNTFQAMNASLEEGARITEGRAKALLRVLLLTDKDRKREEQILSLQRSIQHAESARARIVGRNSGSADSAAAARREAAELRQIENLQERIRKTKWAMSKMEESDKMTPEYKRAATRLQTLSKSIADQQAAMAQIGDYAISDALSEAETKQIEDRIKEITDRLQEMRNAGVNPGMPDQSTSGGIRMDVSAEADEYARLNDELKQLTQQMNSIQQINHQVDAIENVKEKYRETYEAMKDMENNGEAFVDKTHSSRYLELIDDLNVYENKLKELETTYETMNGVPAPNEADIARYRELTAQIDTYNRKLLELNFQSIHEGIVKVGTYAKKHLGSALKKSINVVSSGLKKLASWASKAAKSISSIFKGQSVKSGSNGISKAVEKLTRKFSNLWSMLMTRFKRRAIAAVFNDIKGVFVEMANLNPKFNESINKMVNSSRRLGAQILAIVEPIVVRLGPIIEKLADALAVAADYLAQFSANLFGFSDWFGNDKYTKAEKGNYNFAKSMDEAASSTKNANKAAKEYENTVMGFDQLNKLNGTEEESDADETEAQLERAYTRLDAFNQLAKGIRKAFEEGNYEEAGKRIAETVGYLANAFRNKFGWDKNGEKIKEVLGNVTTTINSFIKWFPAKKVGEALGDVANVIVNSLDFLLNDPEHKLDFSGLGTKIGELLISAFKKINWTNVGRVLIGALRALGDVIRGALTATVEDENGKHTVGTAIGDALRDMLQGAVEMIDPEHLSDVLSTIINALNDALISLTSNPQMFADFGTKLADTINLLVDKVDGSKAKTAISQLASSIGTMLGNFLHGVHWDEVFSGLGSLLQEIIDGIVGGITGGGSVDAGSLLVTALIGALFGSKLGVGGLVGAIAAVLLANGGINLGNLGIGGKNGGLRIGGEKNAKVSYSTVAVNNEYTEGIASGLVLTKALKTAIKNPALGASIIGGTWLGQQFWKFGGQMAYNDMAFQMKQGYGSSKYYEEATGQKWAENFDEFLKHTYWTEDGLKLEDDYIFIPRQVYDDMKITKGMDDETAKINAHNDYMAGVISEEEYRKRLGLETAASEMTDGQVPGDAGVGDFAERFANIVSAQETTTSNLETQTENVDALVKSTQELTEAIKSSDKDMTINIGGMPFAKLVLTALNQLNKQYGQTV